MKEVEEQQDIGRKTEDLSIYLPDKNMPITENIKHRRTGINSLNQKIVARQNKNIRNGGAAEQNVKNESRHLQREGK